MHRGLLLLVILSLLASPSVAHSRWTYPSPRNTSPGIKGPYPCGEDAFWGEGQPVTTLAPGVVTLKWGETINHNGAPFRIALSIGDDNDYNQYVLVDQIPHNDVEASSGEKWYLMNVTIPDINCTKCSLGLVNPMTYSCCDYPSETYGYSLCTGVYHSCANIVITGSMDPTAYSYTYTGPKGSYTSFSASWNSVGNDEYVLNPSYTPYNQSELCPVQAGGSTTNNSGSTETGGDSDANKIVPAFGILLLALLL